MVCALNIRHTHLLKFPRKKSKSVSSEDTVVPTPWREAGRRSNGRDELSGTTGEGSEEEAKKTHVSTTQERTKFINPVISIECRYSPDSLREG